MACFAYVEYYVPGSVGPPENKHGWQSILIKFETLSKAIDYLDTEMKGKSYKNVHFFDEQSNQVLDRTDEKSKRGNTWYSYELPPVSWGNAYERHYLSLLDLYGPEKAMEFAKQYGWTEQTFPNRFKF